MSAIIIGIAMAFLPIRITFHIMNTYQLYNAKKLASYANIKHSTHTLYKNTLRANSSAAVSDDSTQHSERKSTKCLLSCEL